MITGLPEAWKIATARHLPRRCSMSHARATVLLFGVLLSGCLYPRPYGEYSPVYGSGLSPLYGGGFSPLYGSGSSPLYGGGLSPLLESLPYYADRYWSGNRRWYDDRYDGRSARELAEDQARARQRLRRDQQERRQNLLEWQDDRRETRQAEGAWRKRNVRYQRQQRQEQQERFRRARQEQRKRQGRSWD